MATAAAIPHPTTLGGVAWRSDRTQAWMLNGMNGTWWTVVDNKNKTAISLEEAEQFAAQIGLPVP